MSESDATKELLHCLAGGDGWRGQIETIKKCIEDGADVNAPDGDGNSALFYARDAETANYLLKNGADPLAKNCERLTPLQAVIKGRSEIGEARAMI